MKAAAPHMEPALTERDVVSFAIDSREVNAGDLFFAPSQPEYFTNCFNGDFEDATVYVVSALENGAAAAVVRRDRFEEHREQLLPHQHRLVFVSDVIKALQDLAQGIYRQWNGPVVAITGSAGKTTAKELTAHVLGQSGRKILRNIKNYNNGLGHPLTVLKLAADMTYDAAVLEMGMSTPMNEIARLCRITPPDFAVELNVLPVHLEHLGSIEGVAKAKAELVEGMKPGGTAILNADDPFVLGMSDLAIGPVLTFGIDSAADIRASEISFERFRSTDFVLETPSGNAKVSFPLDGRHNIANALAAAAVGHCFGMNAADIAKALSTSTTPPQRGEIIVFADGFTVINDSYNSNPAALLSMVRTLVEGKSPGRKIVVAGEMLELGHQAAEIHRDTGKAIAELGVDRLIGVRGFGRELIEGAKAAGIALADFATDAVAAGEMLAAELTAGDVVLVKGSRGVQTEIVIEKLLEKFEMEKSEAVKR